MEGDDNLTALVDLVQRWRESIEPRTLLERVKDLTSRDYWEHFHEVRRAGEEISHEEAARETEGIYRSFAEEVLKDVHAFAELGEWLGSGDSKSGDVLAHAIARLDGEGRTHGIVGQWIIEGKALTICSGFLRGLSAEQRSAETIGGALEQLADSQPGAALLLTASGDCSEMGFDRIIRCLKECRAEDLYGLRSLVTNSWDELLTEERVLVFAQELRRLQQLEGYHEVTSAVAVEILHLVYSEKTIHDPILAAVVLRILADTTVVSQRDSWAWVQLAKAVQSHDPKAICRLALGQHVESRSGLDKSLNEFVAECARAEPDEAMAVVGEMFTDKKRRWIFRALVFRDLFDSIGVQAVSRYLDAHPDHAAFIARHLKGPSIEEDGILQVPDLADWLISRFSENPEVWDEFMMGRHAFEVFHVPEGYEAAKDMASRFLDHPKAWVRKWAAAEIAYMDWQIKAHLREEDRLERE
jgi:hypothetical protein